MTTNTPKGTPVPWKRSERARWVVLSDTHPRKGICVMQNYQQDNPEPQEADANAALIVKAVNNHQALIDALNEVTSQLEAYTGKRNSPEFQENTRSYLFKYIDKARAALKQVEEEPNV